MKILVLNAGSSSLKYQLIDMESEKVLAKGNADRIGIEGSFCKHKKDGGEEIVKSVILKDHKDAIEVIMSLLVDAEQGCIKSMDEIGAVGHRVVASGEYFKEPTLVTEESIERLKKTFPLGPLHNPAAYTGVMACREVMPSTPMVLVFDTSFHLTMPEVAYLYNIKYEDYKQYSVRRYGAHGTSHKFVSGKAAEYLGDDPKDRNIITCHLGNGSSISAVKGGKCVDTSMGFTPLAGVCMGTRSGDIDASAVQFLANQKGMDINQILTYLNKESGLKGLSGGFSDFRDLRENVEKGGETGRRAQLALDKFAYDCKKYVGAYMAVLGRVDCIVFTAGISEWNGFIINQILEGLEPYGISVDKEKNTDSCKVPVKDITGKDSKVKILVIPTNEELVIARETKEVVTGK
ncbi:MAG: acetate kinase [Lachnospiraceae bacterium]|nr:acetate kinase [Lachnospiraceae bacterium]